MSVLSQDKTRRKREIPVRLATKRYQPRQNKEKERQMPIKRFKVNRSIPCDCLSCGEPFKSYDLKKNRICPSCTRANVQRETHTRWYINSYNRTVYDFLPLIEDDEGMRQAKIRAKQSTDYWAYLIEYLDTLP